MHIPGPALPENGLTQEHIYYNYK